MDSFSKFCWADIVVDTGIALVEVFSCDMSNPNLNDSASFPLSVLPKQPVYCGFWFLFRKFPDSDLG